ncbi:MAG: hypothetical protein ACXU86_15760, partial [Archangium sp.]
FMNAVGAVAARGCTATMDNKIGLSQGQPTTNPDIFPPPFCFVPPSAACTFCSGDGVTKPLRGAIFFEPDGTVTFTDAQGNPATAGSASITFLPTGGSGMQSAQAVVITNTGLVRTFSAQSTR